MTLDTLQEGLSALILVYAIFSSWSLLAPEGGSIGRWLLGRGQPDGLTGVVMHLMEGIRKTEEKPWSIRELRRDSVAFEELLNNLVEATTRDGDPNRQ